MTTSTTFKLTLEEDPNQSATSEEGKQLNSSSSVNNTEAVEQEQGEVNETQEEVFQRELKRWDMLPWTSEKTPAEEFISLGIDFDADVHTLKHWKLILPDIAMDV